MPVHCPLSNNGSTWLFSFSPNHLWILRDLCFLFWSPSSLSSSPHLKPQQSHSLLTCMTTGIVHSTSLWPALQNSQSLFFPTSRRKKTTRKHTNTNIAIFFFFTVTWKHSTFHHCCETAESLLSASQILPTAEPEIPLPNHCSEPNKRLLNPNSPVPYARTDFPSCPPCASGDNSPLCKRKHQVSGSHSHRLSEHWGLFTVLFGSQIQHLMCYGEGKTLPSSHLTSP